MKIANDWSEFIAKVLNASASAFNSTDEGKEIIQKLYDESLRKNPNLTKEEWEKIKQDFLVVSTLSFVKDIPELKSEFGDHLFTELNKMD